VVPVVTVVTNIRHLADIRRSGIQHMDDLWHGDAPCGPPSGTAGQMMNSPDD
jgi:hypothetical protein